MKAYYQCYQRSLLGVFWLSACNLNFLLPPLSLNHINTNKVHLGGVEKLNRTLYKKQNLEFKGPLRAYNSTTSFFHQGKENSESK